MQNKKSNHFAVEGELFREIYSLSICDKYRIYGSRDNFKAWVWNFNDGYSSASIVYAALILAFSYGILTLI